MRKLHAETALLPGGWATDVDVAISADGRIAAVVTGTAPGPEDEFIHILLPAPCNLHSHAFQRALAGLTERRGDGDDDFWSWREAMYRFLPRLGPQEIETIAAYVYSEMAEGGFAAVAEFHYLHHAPDGAAYADPAETSARIAHAAKDAGIGLTLLPVFYAQGGFGGVPPGEGQRRFINNVDGYLRLREAARAHLVHPDDAIGAAPHSLRAVTPGSLTAVADATQDGPVHIHIAEQVKEVEDCLAWSGRRPVDWLLENCAVDARWTLVHATHMTGAETQAAARSGAVAGLCPTTEADLGDGVFPAPAWLTAGGRFGIGTDSHVRTGAAGELRLLEWSQRLSLRRRNVFAAPGGSTGRALYDGALKGGAQALGRASGAIETGLFADLVSLKAEHPMLAGKTGDALLDSWIFAGDRTCVDSVWSAGRRIVESGWHVRHDGLAARFRAVMRKLLAA
ncbi:MAG: formimidoylglutamate deiminase [Maricaulaceae bacterium]|nr:formimidoylglutamate deiminase [Maricaulaceae bacterium]